MCDCLLSGLYATSSQAGVSFRPVCNGEELSDLLGDGINLKLLTR